MRKKPFVQLLALALLFVAIFPAGGATVSADEPLNVFVLPIQGQTEVSIENVQTKYPDVAWSTLDRLYIPAGKYRYITIRNLPQRSASDPLVITNYGGQVLINEQERPMNQRHGYSLWLSGGSNWVLTGEYDPVQQTGHPSYVGHKNGGYGDSEGRYGIEVTHTRDSALKVDSATGFELSYVEVGHAGFAGLLIKSDNQPLANMDDVKIHDLYIHDNESEGAYIGNTSKDSNAQHKFTNLQFYNNRIVRSGTEGLQLSHLGDGAEIHHNVILFSALDWKDPFQIWQDGAFQLTARDGDIDIHHNIVIGSGGDLFNVHFLARTASPGSEIPAQGEVYVHDNYFSHSRSFFSYLNNPTPQQNTTSGLRLENNFISGIQFQANEVKLTETDTNKLINALAPSNPISINDNVYEGTRTFIGPLNAANGDLNNYHASGNANADVTDVEFRDPTFSSDFDYSLLERWTYKSTAYNALYNLTPPNEIAITYNAGDYVVHEGKMYQSIQTHVATEANAPGNASYWTAVPWMTDDLRLASSSPHQGLGLLPDGGASGDVIPPSAISDLAVASIQSTSLRLSWTVPGDDGNTGDAKYYDIRYSESPITGEGDWAAATRLGSEPIPTAAGTTQTMLVKQLSQTTTYYFAMKAADESENKSSLSNAVSATTKSPSSWLDLTSSTVTNESGYGNANLLADEQSLVGDPRGGTGGAPVTYWDPGYQAGRTPAFAYIDLGQVYDIDRIYLRDYQNQGNFTVYAGSPGGTWTPLFTDPCATYQTWNEHIVENVQTRYLRFQKTTNSANVSEIAVYTFGPVK
ncbi:discoidin domain-containing protein [Cohnella herbarum]|uniref:Fibronectin type-III domain-containing protein n=1 Tax=Cohnella herbarum TaxID=2728023 RepID=A0A7Z2VQZ4_9BACL|nr:discoidin domain-containing protein [Cohnella herbarum]QJD87315.1 hypothetical protein HH215_31830 [Cohnella herbarum]